jgi:hypothetical protein
MNAILLITVGQRDVQLLYASPDGTTNRAGFPSAKLREWSEGILNHVEKGGDIRFECAGNATEYKQKNISGELFSSLFEKSDSTALCFPIIERGIIAIQSRSPDLVFNKVVLFNTERPAVSPFSGNEPTAFSSILKHGLPHLFPAMMPPESFQTMNVRRENEISRGDFFTEYEQWFQQNLLHSSGSVYVFRTGGIPGMGEALTSLASLYVPAEKLRIYEQPELGTASISLIPDYLRMMRDRHSIMQALSLEDFKSAWRMWHESMFRHSQTVHAGEFRLCVPLMRAWLEGSKEWRSLYAEYNSFIGKHRSGINPSWIDAFDRNRDIRPVMLYARTLNAFRRGDFVMTGLLVRTLLEITAKHLFNSWWKGCINETDGDSDDRSANESLFINRLPEAIVGSLRRSGFEVSTGRMLLNTIVYKTLLKPENTRGNRPLQRIEKLWNNPDVDRLRDIRNIWLHQGEARVNRIVRSALLLGSVKHGCNARRRSPESLPFFSRMYEVLNESFGLNCADVYEPVAAAAAHAIQLLEQIPTPFLR